MRRCWPQGAPYRIILVEGAVERLPEGLWSQLGEGGRAVLLRPAQGMKGRASVFRRAGGTVSEVPAFDASAPVLPAFAAPAGFRF